MGNERLAQGQEQWEQAAHEALDAFLQRVKASLTEDASIASIEKVLFEHENGLMSELFSLLAQRQLPPPGNTRDT